MLMTAIPNTIGSFIQGPYAGRGSIRAKMLNDSPTAAGLLGFIRMLSPSRVPALRAACLRVLEETTNPTDLEDRLDEVFVDIASYEDELRTVVPSLGDLAALVDLPYDSHLPRRARAAFCEITRCVLASLATVVALDTQRRLDPWLATALASTISKGLRSLETGALAILPPLLSGGTEGVEQRFAGEMRDARAYEDFLLSFYTSREKEGSSP